MLHCDCISVSSEKTLYISKSLKNVSKETGDFLKLRCEVEGDVPATDFRWLVNDALLVEEKNRVRVKTNLAARPQWSQLRIKELEALDKAFYQCVASNGIDTVSSTAIVKVKMGSFGGGRGSGGSGDNEGLVPISYGTPAFAGMDNVEFEGNKVPGNLNGNSNLRPGGVGGGGGGVRGPGDKSGVVGPGNRFQVWSQPQFYSVGFLRPRIIVKRCFFYKHLIKVCMSCFQCCSRGSMPSVALLKVSLYRQKYQKQQIRIEFEGP